MAINGSLSASATCSGRGYTFSFSETGETGISHSVSCAKAYSGTFTTDTITASHGATITNSDYVSLWWSGGAAYHCDVTGVSGDDITIDDGTTRGDALPTGTGVAVTIAVESEVDDVSFDGDDAKMYCVNCGDYDCQINYRQDVTAETHVALTQVTGGEGFFWVNSLGTTSPLTGAAIGKIGVATKNTSEDQTVNIGLICDTV